MEKKMTPLRAIKAKCLDCCCGNVREVALCPATDCPLYAFRKGKGAKRESNLTSEQKKAMRERLHKPQK